MDINQIYRAPAIPKLSKRNISSSVLRASSAISSTNLLKPRLKVTRFGFRPSINLREKLEALKPKPLDAEKILSKKQDTEENTYKALAETNRILVEIQKQLSLDFAMRIAEEKEAVKKIKSAESKRKFAEKEKSIEGLGKKIGETGKYITDKLTAPVKSVFDKIKEFFSLILTGIVLNKAFAWLQDPANKQKLFAVFDFVGKYWKEIIGVFIGVKLFGFIYKLIKLGKLISRFFGRGGPGSPGGRGPGNKPGPPNNKPGPGGGGCGRVLDCIKDIGGSAAEKLAEALKKTRVFSPLFGLIPRLKPINQPTPVNQPKPVDQPTGQFDPSKDFSYYQSRGMSRQEWNRRRLQNISGFEGGIDTLSGIRKEPELSAIIYGTVLSVLAGFGLRGAARASFLRGNPNQYPVKAGPLQARFANLGQGARNIPKRTPQQALEEQLRRHTSDAANGVKLFTSRSGMSLGGTVGGTGSGNVDSVRAMLAPGEEVIRTASAMMFRPLLKDINDNAGRLWTLFTQAVRKLFSVSEYQREVSTEFSKVIEDFNKYLKDEILKKKTRPKGGGMRPPTISTKTNIAPPAVSAAPRITNISMNVSTSTGSGGMTFLPMVLPKQSSKPPQIPQMQGKSTDVPVISPINFANPYMEVTPSLYGIQLIV